MIKTKNSRGFGFEEFRRTSFGSNESSQLCVEFCAFDNDQGNSSPNARKKIGRPLVYAGDVDSPHLTEAERRKVKRRLANRESARRVRQRRQEDLHDLHAEFEALRHQNCDLVSRIARVERDILTAAKKLRQTCTCGAFFAAVPEADAPCAQGFDQQAVLQPETEMQVALLDAVDPNAGTVVQGGGAKANVATHTITTAIQYPTAAMPCTAPRMRKRTRPAAGFATTPPSCCFLGAAPHSLVPELLVDPLVVAPAFPMSIAPQHPYGLFSVGTIPKPEMLSLDPPASRQHSGSLWRSSADLDWLLKQPPQELFTLNDIMKNTLA